MQQDAFGGPGADLYSAFFKRLFAKILENRCVSHCRTFPSPPAVDDDEAYLWIDHREDDAAIVELISARLAPDDELTVDESEDRMSVRHRGQAHLIPLQYIPQDRYTVISSLAKLLRGNYAFFLLRPSPVTDTHGLLVVPLNDTAGWSQPPGHLTPLKLGYDYFHGVDIPYVHQEQSTRNALAGLAQVVISGNADVDLASELARLARTDPQLREAARGKSEADLLAEIKESLGESFASSEFLQVKRELDETMSRLQELVKHGKTPWWKRKWFR